MPNILQRKLSISDQRELLNAIKTTRQREAEILQSYYDGNMYEGRPSYLDRESDTPRLERAPCVRYPLVKAAVDSNVALAMGGTRFPRVLSMSSEDDSDFDPDFGLNKADSRTADQFNAKLIGVAGLEQPFRQAYRMAQVARSAVMLLSYRQGLPYVDVISPKICTPTFDDNDPDCVIAVEIRFRYVDSFWNADARESWPVVREYRRVIDQKQDVVYATRDVWDKDDITPTSAVQRKTVHGFGFCPVRWYARQRPSFAVGGYDGIAVHDGKLVEIDAINHALSSRHIGAMYAGDPIMFGAGISPDDSFGQPGRVARADMIDPMAKPTEWDRTVWGFGGRSGGAIRKEPGALYRVDAPDAKLSFLTLPADALDAIDKHAQDLCSKVREALKYVWIDPEQLTGSGDVSGKTLSFVFSSQVNALNDDRADFWRACMLPTLGLIYRMLVTQSDGVFLPGLKKTLPILQRFLVQLAGGRTVFMAPQLQARWGDYFEPSDVDEATRVSTSTGALTAGVITTATAVEHIKDVFAISNVDQYVESLAAEKVQRQADAVANAQAMATAAPGQPPPPASGAKAAVAPAAKQGKQPPKRADKGAQ